MPNVNLSTLSGPELRRLLDSSRQRGEAALSYRILQEMEARRESGERKGLFPIRRSAAEPHTVAVNLGVDPMARDDEDDVPPMPFWRAPSQVAEASPEPEPPPPAPSARRSRRREAPAEPSPMRIEPVAAFDDEPRPEPEASLGLRFDDPEPPEDTGDGAQDWDLRMHPPQVKTSAPPRGLRRGLAAGFAVGIAAGVGLGWWVWGTAREAPSPPVAPAMAPVQTAALVAPSSPPPAAPAPVVAAPETAPAAAAPEPDIAPTPPESVETSEEAASPAPESRPAPQVAPQPAPAAHREADACAAEPTPADRTICGDPQLRGLQRQLRQAYNEALEAHEDRALLRQRQLAWASARDTVSDPDNLAQLYEQRIRKLNAATAAAREQR